MVASHERAAHSFVFMLRPAYPTTSARENCVQEFVHHVLVVATSKEILLLAVSFTNEHNLTIAADSLNDVSHAQMYLLPDALFKVSVAVIDDSFP